MLIESPSCKAKQLINNSQFLQLRINTYAQFSRLGSFLTIASIFLLSPVFNSIFAQTLTDDIKDVPKEIRISFIRDKMKGMYKKDSTKTKNELDAAYAYYKNDKFTYAILISAEATFRFKNGQVEKAMELEKKALELFDQLGEVEGSLGCLSRITKYYDRLSKQDEGLSFLFDCLKNTNGNNERECLLLERIGLTFKEMKNEAKALEYFQQASEKAKYITASNRQLTKTLLSIDKNLGVLYRNKGDFKNAEYHLNKALAMSEQAEDEGYKGIVLNSLGVLYSQIGEYYKAIKAYEESIRIKNETENYQGMATSYANLGDLYMRTNNMLKAEIALNKALEYVPYVEDIIREQHVYAMIAMYYGKLGKSLKAYPYLLKAYELKDSAYRNTIAEETAKMEAVYNNDKKQKEIEVGHLRNQQLEDSVKAKNRERNIFIAGSLVLLVLLFFSVISYVGKRRANKELETKNTVIGQQKALVEEQHKEIIDSINYAKRLQEAILPSDQFLNAQLEDYFVYYKPKDIVAGDFYWMEKIGDQLLVCVADCTGHGVPGAMVSLVCSNALNRSVNEFSLTDPGKILDKTRELVLENFSKSDNDVKDGMDVSFLALNKKSGEIKWSGANNPLWYIHNNGFVELKGDKQPIGRSEFPKPFTTHSPSLSKGDLVFLFSDGYADQFGGPKGKKFKYKQFQQILIDSRDKPMNEIRQIVDDTFTSWQGSLEQVDDVCVFGLRI